MKRLLFIALAITLLASCSAQKKVLYMQDSALDTKVETVEGGELRLQPDDIVSIFVTSERPELAAIFNLPRVQQVIGNSYSYSGINGQNGTLNYTVNQDGKINFPVLGEIEIAGMTKMELTREIEQRIIENGLIKDPVVIVDYVNLSFSAVGELTRPGNYRLTKEKTNLFEALSMAGDLTINGVRDRVYVTRKAGNELITYQLDIRSTDIYLSPAFYIQQNDVIYVEPNRYRANQSTVNANSLFSTSFWLSLASLLTTITAIIL